MPENVAGKQNYKKITKIPQIPEAEILTNQASFQMTLSKVTSGYFTMAHQKL